MPLTPQQVEQQFQYRVEADRHALYNQIDEELIKGADVFLDKSNYLRSVVVTIQETATINRKIIYEIVQEYRQAGWRVIILDPELMKLEWRLAFRPERDKND